jgi:hypothetical protein
MRVLLVAVFMVLATGVGAQEGQGVAPESPPIQEQPNGSAGRPDAVAPPGFAVRIVESPEDAEDRRNREKKSDQHETDDLAAQRKAADAAERSATTAEGQIIPTWIQAAVAIVGTIALLVTIAFSIKATNAAVQSSNIAEEALADARVNAKRQLRAYLTSRGATLNYKDGLLTGSVEITNSGQTPARKARSWIVVVIEKPPFDEAWLKEEVRFSSMSDKGAGDYIVPKRVVNVHDEFLLLKVHHKEVGVWIHGHAVYDDIFGDSHTVSYRYAATYDEHGILVATPTPEGCHGD